ncbi:UNVERIFIED_CONTAM: hypothetical protein BJ099_1073 [Lysinibacillus xylanilyticus]
MIGFFISNSIFKSASKYLSSFNETNEKPNFLYSSIAAVSLWFV